VKRSQEELCKDTRSRKEGTSTAGLCCLARPSGQGEEPALPREDAEWGKSAKENLTCRKP